MEEQGSQEVDVSAEKLVTGVGTRIREKRGGYVSGQEGRAIRLERRSVYVKER